MRPELQAHLAPLQGEVAGVVVSVCFGVYAAVANLGQPRVRLARL